MQFQRRNHIERCVQCACVQYVKRNFNTSPRQESDTTKSKVMLLFTLMILLISVQLPLIEIHLYGGKCYIEYIQAANILWINHIVICLNQKLN